MTFLDCHFHFFSKSSKVLAKRELLYVPLIGWTWYFLEIVFCKRKWEEDRDTVIEGLKRLSDYPEYMWVSVESFLWYWLLEVKRWQTGACGFVCQEKVCLLPRVVTEKPCSVSGGLLGYTGRKLLLFVGKGNYLGNSSEAWESFLNQACVMLTILSKLIFTY